MRSASIASFSLLLSFVTSSVLADEASKTDGTWHPVSAVLGGRDFPKEVRESIVLKLSGDQYSVTVNGTPDKGTCTIDRTVTPHQMTIKGTVGPNQGKTLLAIFEISDKGLLRVCYDLSGKEFPKEFKSPSGTTQYLVEYRKELADGAEITGTITDVPDSDVLLLRAEDKKLHRIRLNGIDAPELKQDFGTNAQAELSRLVKDKAVRVVTHSEDRGGQIIGDVYVKLSESAEETFLNVHLVAEGLAWHFVRYAPDNKVLAESEKKARDAKAGLWKEGTPTAPWDWRRQQADEAKKK
ncbi:MAG: thermonuclease family protein [Planctomycetaceae bacterium]|nr:thermonuclease family protein [Planctomycetaceae bacterium]